MCFTRTSAFREFVRYIDSSRTHLFDDVIYINTEKNNIPIEVAIMYNTSYSENLHSYVNNINTIEGGTHLVGFRSAVTRVLKKYAEETAAKQLEKAKVEIAGEDFREGLTAVISVKAGGTAVRRTNENEAGQQRGGRCGEPGCGRGADLLPRRTPEGGQTRGRQGDSGCYGTCGCPQGARKRAAQESVLGRWSAG